MLLKSLDDAGPGQEVPVTIFSLGTKRKFLATPDDYTDLVRIVRRKFDIPNDSVPIFQSRAPTSHRSDERFEIDDSAYSLMKTYFDEIEIVVKEGIPQEGTNSDDVKGKAKAKDILPASPSSPPSSPRQAYKASSSKLAFGNEPPTSADSTFTLSTSSSANSKHISVTPTSSAQSDPHDLFNDDIPVEYASPKKKKSTKAKDATPKAIPQHVYNVDVNEDESPTAPQPSTSKLGTKSIINSKSSSSEWEELSTRSKGIEGKEDTVGGTLKGPRLSHKHDAPKADEDIVVSVKKEKTNQPPSSSSRAKDPKTSGRMVASDGQSMTLLTQNTDSSVQSQTQFLTQSGTQNTASADPEPRFKIKIWGPRHQNGEFMTRKKHTVRKVLAGACRNFGIDPNQAKLQQVIELPDEITGEIISHYCECDNEDTVGKAGIGPESTLRVYVEGEEDEEYEEANNH